MIIRNPHTKEEKLTPKGERQKQAKQKLTELKKKGKAKNLSDLESRIEEIEKILGI